MKPTTPSGCVGFINFLSCGGFVDFLGCVGFVNLLSLVSLLTSGGNVEIK